MADDNVVRPNFGKKKPEVDKPKTNPPEPNCEAVEKDGDYYDPSSLTGEILVRAQKDLLYALAHQDHVNKSRDKIEAIGDFIFSLKNFTPNKHNIKLRRQGLHSYTLADICELVDSSQESEWRSQPSYFAALTLEYHYRIKAALSLMPDDKKTAVDPEKCDPNPDS